MSTQRNYKKKINFTVRLLSIIFFLLTSGTRKQVQLQRSCAIAAKMPGSGGSKRTPVWKCVVYKTAEEAVAAAAASTAELPESEDDSDDDSAAVAAGSTDDGGGGAASHAEGMAAYVQGNALQHHGQWAAALAQYKLALGVAEARPGTELHMNMHIIRNDIAMQLLALGDFAEGLEVSKLTIRAESENAGSESNSRVAPAYRTLGCILCAKGDYATATTMLETALALIKQAVGARHADVGITLNALSRVQRKQGDYDRALGTVKEALGILTIGLGGHSHYVGKAYANLAVIQRCKGEWDEASRTCHQARAVFQAAVGGDDHPYIAQTFQTEGIILRNQERYDEATAVYERAYTMITRICGPAHIDNAGTLMGWAIVCKKRMRLDEAMDKYKEALDIQLRVLGPNHNDVGSTYGNIANVLSAQGKSDEALQMYETSLNIKLLMLGKEHPAIADSQFNIALELAQAEERTLTFGVRATNPRILKLFTEAHYAYNAAYGNRHRKTQSAKRMVEKYGGVVNYHALAASEPEI